MSTRSAVVTGASSGIGRAIALRRAAAGLDVVLADIRRDPIAGGETTEEMIRQAGGLAVHLDADVSREGDCARMVEVGDAMMAVNLRGAYLLCRAAVRQMLEQPLVGDVRGR